MTDDAVRERHGVKSLPDSDAKEVLLREGEQTVTIALGMRDANLTPWQARYLAAKLYRMARRIRQRNEASMIAIQIMREEAA